LAAWFGAFLGGFHAYFAFRLDWTTADNRALDYYYLGTAALSLLLFAGTYENQRAKFIEMVALDIEQQLADGFKKRLRAETAYYRDEACATETERGKRHCEKANELSLWINSDHNAEETKQAADGFDAFVASDLAGYPLQWVTRNEQGVDIAVTRNVTRRPEGMLWYGPPAVQKAFKDLLAFEAKSQKHPRSNDIQNYLEPPNVWLGFGQTVLWPFVLAIAFALRITKTTIEVRKWTVD
jgi:hypothetical protein